MPTDDEHDKTHQTAPQTPTAIRRRLMLTAAQVDAIRKRAERLDEIACRLRAPVFDKSTLLLAAKELEVVATELRAKASGPMV